MKKIKIYKAIKIEQWKDYQKKKGDIEILKRKLVQAKPELREWIEMHFGRVKE